MGLASQELSVLAFPSRSSVGPRGLLVSSMVLQGNKKDLCQ